MVTYEEFLKKNGIDNIKRLAFSQKEQLSVDATIKGNPEEYIDVAKKATELEYIRVEANENKKYYDSLTEFIKNCNEKVEIANNVVGKANKNEYLKGEEKINQIISEIDPKWSTKQKSAYLHYKMGEILSYAPDFNFNEKNTHSKEIYDVRNIWKSLSEGKSVCNGITKIEKNILSRLGIESEELSSGSHAFLLIKTEEGNIITDPTWDLANSLYKARPMYFSVTYEELRKREMGISNAHKLEKQPENVIEISSKELRDIYKSIGLTTKEGTFPLPILDEIEKINAKPNATKEEKIQTFLKMFPEKFPEEAKHLAETRSMLETCINELGIENDKIKTKFVYSKSDINSERPYLMVHINSKEMKDQIQILNAEENKFSEIELQEFDKEYKVHNFDTAKPFWKQYMQEKEEIKENIQEK